MKATLLGCLVLAAGLGFVVPASADVIEEGDDAGPAARRPAPATAVTPAPEAPASEPVIQPATGRAVGTGEGFYAPTLTGDWRFRGTLNVWVPNELPFAYDAPDGGGTDNLTLYLNWLLPALSGYYIPLDFELRKGSFGLFLHTLSWQVRGDAEIGRLNIRWQNAGQLFDTGVSYELGSWNLGDGPRAPTLTVEPFFGARILHDPVEVDTALVGGDIDEFSNYVPIIGLRTFWNLTEHWNLRVSGDYGGFGVDRNEQTWKVEALVGYRWRGWGVGWNVQAGYRAMRLLRLKLKRGRITFDPRGPVVAMSVEF
jgi:hypothetical protein